MCLIILLFFYISPLLNLQLIKSSPHLPPRGSWDRFQLPIALRVGSGALIENGFMDIILDPSRVCVGLASAGAGRSFAGLVPLDELFSFHMRLPNVQMNVLNDGGTERARFTAP